MSIVHVENITENKTDCLGYMYDNRDTLLPMCEKCSCQASYESEE